MNIGPSEVRQEVVEMSKEEALVGSRRFSDIVIWEPKADK